MSVRRWMGDETRSSFSAGCLVSGEEERRACAREAGHDGQRTAERAVIVREGEWSVEEGASFGRHSECAGERQVRPTSGVSPMNDGTHCRTTTTKTPTTPAIKLVGPPSAVDPESGGDAHGTSSGWGRVRSLFWPLCLHLQAPCPPHLEICRCDLSGQDSR